MRMPMSITDQSITDQFWRYAKEAILSAMVEREMQEVTRVVKNAVDREPDGFSKLRAFILQHHKTLMEMLPIILLLRREIQAREHGALTLLVEQTRKFTLANAPMLEGFLREGMVDGSVRKLNKPQVESVARFLALSIRGLEYEYLLGDADERLSDHVKIALGVLDRGISP